ncbi:hypothetical protein ACSNOI_44650, partial [Actinomadura kijaniata]|uniref:hypothetical protein n=1 Tax=Actinomadura kijaniata TaxID=46161 RepID=UPI003F1B407C
RRRLEEAFLGLAESPRRIAVAGVALGLLAFAVIVASVSWHPSFTPLYGLQSSVENTLSRIQISLD